MDVSVMSYRQSLRACASLFIARKLLKDENDYGNNIWDYNLRFKSLCQRNGYFPPSYFE